MYVDFDKLPDNARVWVYQANRLITESEVKTIEESLESDLHQWAAHGQPLLGSAHVVTNRFVIVGVDEGYNLPSGCSIDASVRIMRQIGQQLSVDFFDRSVAVQLADGSMQTFVLAAIKVAIADGTITQDTTIINTLIKTKAEFLADWHIHAVNSWLKRYFKTSTV